VFPVDDVTIEWLRNRIPFVAQRGPAGVTSDADGNGADPRLNEARLAELESDRPAADADAVYSRRLFLELDSVAPHVSGPGHVKKMTSVADLKSRKVKIDKAYLMSCVNGRVEDLAEAAAVVRGKKVAASVEFYLAAASDEVQAESEKRGDWQALVDAGAIVLPPGCGACIGLGKGTLADGEVGISATNRNFKGRMGSRDAEAYLASPAVVAASAIAGFIDYERAYKIEPVGGMEEVPPRQRTAGEVTILDGFPESVSGEIMFCHQDNLNTDGIYPGKYTYIDDFTPDQQAGVVMENYDPEFGKLVSDGDILVGGFNFGTGSSREQAATALKYRGIRLVIAGSFSETYKRNALNNGFLALEAPKLTRDLKQKFGTDKLSIRTGITATVDFRRSQISAEDGDYAISPVGTAAQELVLAGGLENWVKQSIRP
jgi:homoaconitate hydratase